MMSQGSFQALNLSTHRSIIGRSTAQHMIRTVVLIHLGVISSGRASLVAHLFVDQVSSSSVIADERIGCGAVVSSTRPSLRPKIKTKRPPMEAIAACSNQNDAGLIRS